MTQTKVVDLLHRHGDVSIGAAVPLPADAREVEVTGDVLLALGEVTGHAHRIRQGSERTVRVWEAQGQRYVTVAEPEVLGHEEHRAQVLAPTSPLEAYPVYIAQELDDSDEWRQVAD